MSAPSTLVRCVCSPHLLSTIYDKILPRTEQSIQGTNIWAHVHIQDVADMILLSVKYNLAATKPAGFERFYL